ncbi:MAG: PIG-L family deacetylase [Cyclobacteriaceae bacterium]|nr:PIG-L family deacetylase [Cyclobacteriaceae bacterium]
MRILALCLITCLGTVAQNRQQPSSAAILLKLKKLNVLGSVLYVAAHPDDENTRAIAYFANDPLVTTAYLSLTRGDGGQNLIGPEIRDQLGLIRTQELLAARRLDGGQQFFTRANDFGFSKNPNETFAIWGKEQILHDVVYVIRQYQPDVIITRFPPDERAGHGHHTASAILAQEAFELAADANAFPDQLKTVGTWQAKRLYTNTGRWWNQTINEKTPGVLSVNVGTYNPLLGKSSSELAAESRSQHKSQGFGSAGRRGDALEFFEYVKGEKAAADFFESVDRSWKRVPGGAPLEKAIQKIIADYQPANPPASVPGLLAVRARISALPTSVWKNRKLTEVEELIQDCLGLFVEVASDDQQVSPGQRMKLNIEVINRSNQPVQLTRIQSASLAWDSALVLPVAGNKLYTFASRQVLAKEAAFSEPFWLAQDHGLGTFVLPTNAYIGQAENAPAISVAFEFMVAGQPYVVRAPAVFKLTDPVKGELTKPLAIVPPVTVQLSQSVFLFRDPGTQPVTITVRSSGGTPTNGFVSLRLPAGWQSTPEKFPFAMSRKGEELSFRFQLTPSGAESTEVMTAVAEVNGQTYDRSLQTIEYDHIPLQTLLPKARARLLRSNIHTLGKNIAYIKGAGDEVPTALRNLGYEVWEMKNEEVTLDNLRPMQAVVLGVRALNTNHRIRYLMPALLAYVEQGGNLIVQYNTNFDLEIDPDKFSPFPLTLSRERVTDENSEVRFLQPDHPVVSAPNRLTPADFDGWVQERGLYFPSAWDAAFQPIFSMNDVGEPPRHGSLLIAPYGKGNYVYTGLSFFRELPEGVVGAYKLFANLVSLPSRSAHKSPSTTPANR